MGYWDEREKVALQDEEPGEKPTLEELETQCVAELDDVAKSFRSRMANENKRFRDMCDTEYWCCVCFTSRKQRDEFLESIEMNPDEKYIDGREIARKIGKALKAEDQKFARVGKPDKAFSDRTM